MKKYALKDKPVKVYVGHVNQAAASAEVSLATYPFWGSSESVEATFNLFDAEEIAWFRERLGREVEIIIRDSNYNKE